MIFERGMGTLMTVCSGVAALMCLLVGLQLIFLESQIGQAAELADAGSGGQFRQWSAEAHTGAVMSFGAGVLILLLGIRHHLAARSLKTPTPTDGKTLSGEDFDSLSVRVFEVDDQNGTVEVHPPEESPREEAPHSWAPHADQEEKPQLVADPTESIVRFIHETSARSLSSGSNHRQNPFKSLLKNIFGQQRPRRR